jgi:serine/threonine protein phosphatase PrpC
MIADGRAAADALIAAALEAGAPDNVTVALCGNISKLGSLDKLRDCG